MILIAAGFGRVRWRTGLKPLYRRRSKKLRTAIDTWIIDTDDQGRFPEVNPPRTIAVPIYT